MGSVLAAYTLIHVVISLLAIAAGLVVFYGLLARQPLEAWTKFFLATTVATSVTGFGFPVDHLMPAHLFGVLSLLALGLAIYARYRRHLQGGWGRTYVVTALIALYLNVFVLIVQSFLKVPALKALAPTQSEAPFLLAQAATLAAFVILGALATIRFPRQP